MAKNNSYKAINQNDLLDVIHSMAEYTNAMVVIINDISKKISSISKINDIDVKIFKKYLNNIKYILEIYNDLLIKYNTKSYLIKFLAIKTSLKSLRKLIEIYSSLNTLKLFKIDLLQDILLESIHNIKDIFDTISSIKIKDLLIFGFKIKKITHGLDLLNSFIIKMEELIKFNKNQLIIYIGLHNTNLIISKFIETITLLNSISTFALIKIGLKIKMCGLLITSINNISQDLKNIKTTTSDIKSIMMLHFYMFRFSKTMDLLLSINAGLRARLKIKSIDKTLNKIKKLIENIINFQTITKREKIINNNIKFIKNVITSLVKIFLIISLSTPILLLCVISIPIWLLGIYALKLFINYINNIFTIKGNKRLLRKINSLIFIISKLTIIFATLVATLPAVIAGTLALPVWMLAIISLWGTLLLINLLIKFIGKIITIKSFLALIELQLFIGMLGLIMIQVAALGVLSILGIVGAVGILGFLLVMILVSLAIAGFSALMIAMAPILLPSILVFGIVFMVISMIVLMAIMLNTLALIKLDKDKILNNVDAIINTARTIIDGIFGKVDEKEDGESKPWYQPVINLLGIGGDLIKAILAIPFLSLTIISISLISFLAIQLRILQTLNLDNVLINKNISTVINAAQAVANAINTSVNEEGFNKKTGLGKLVKVFAPRLSNIADAISSVGFIAITSISIGMLANLAQNLQDIEKFNVNDSIITEKVNKIINTSQIIINTVLGSQENGLIGKIKAKLQEANATDVIKKYRDIVEEIAEISRVSWNSIDEKTVKNNKSITDNYIQFVEKINKVDIKKLETAANMFAKMAEFSKSINGNFEKLAESLNEDLMPVLEELKETLNKIPEKIDTNAASVSQSVAAYAAPAVGPSTQYGMTAQVQRENPNMSKEDVQKVVDKRLNEQARAQAQSLESKFDELIELLKSGMVRVDLT